MQAKTPIHCCWKSEQRRDKRRQRPKSTAAGNLYREGINSGKDPNPLLLEICTEKGKMQAKTHIDCCWYREGINAGKDTNPLLLEICTEKG